MAMMHMATGSLPGEVPGREVVDLPHPDQGVRARHSPHDWQSVGAVAGTSSYLLQV